jgi:hypothetical protein
MMKLETLKAGISLVGIEPTLIATVIAVVPIGDGAVQILYKTPEGTIKERLLGRAPEARSPHDSPVALFAQRTLLT